jgi:protein-tyrosine phosphatase
MSKHTVLFVCLGNICRSPTAEGVFRYRLENANLSSAFVVDSAGTGHWHVGSPPDRRAQETALQRGIDISHLRGRQVNDDDMERFDYIIAMDRANQQVLQQRADLRYRDKIHLMLEFTDAFGLIDVPDPYYGGDGGFDQVIDLIERASDGLLEAILARQ